jgi:hypothetical protein
MENEKWENSAVEFQAPGPEVPVILEARPEIPDLKTERTKLAEIREEIARFSKTSPNLSESIASKPEKIPWLKRTAPLAAVALTTAACSPLAADLVGKFITDPSPWWSAARGFSGCLLPLLTIGGKHLFSNSLVVGEGTNSPPPLTPEERFNLLGSRKIVTRDDYRRSSDVSGLKQWFKIGCLKTVAGAVVTTVITQASFSNEPVGYGSLYLGTVITIALVGTYLQERALQNLKKNK